MEIEFAVRLPQRRESPPSLDSCRFVRWCCRAISEDLRMGDVDPAQLVCQSTKVLGNGRIENLHDIVVVDSHRFERGRSQEVAEAVAHFNAKLSAENRPYLLIGVGAGDRTIPGWEFRWSGTKFPERA